jgi:hypothetical protein
MNHLKHAGGVFIWLLLSQALFAFSEDSIQVIPNKSPDYHAYNMLQLPGRDKFGSLHQIIVAVVDDGFNLEHKSISKYLYHNSAEIPDNGIDDDANGYVDDVTGWDIADNDNSTSIPKGRETFFYHGTMIAGIITTIAERSLGTDAQKYLKILPVKCLSDRAEKANMLSGYDGIEYAVKQGADIIVCAWSGGRYDEEKYKHIFDEANKKGITIIGSAGNFYSEQVDPPASVSTVYAISSIDSNMIKLPSGNYGRKVDLVACGDQVYAPHPMHDYTYFYGGGSSSANALVSGCAALLKMASYTSTPQQLFRALKNTATPVDSLNRYYAAKLGAGVPNTTAALSYLQTNGNKDVFFNPKKAVGDIIIDHTSKLAYWEISPIGGIKSIAISLKGNKEKLKGKLNIYCKDSLFRSFGIESFPKTLVVPGGYARVQYTGQKPSSNNPLIVSYSCEPVDSTTLYCKDIKYYRDNEGYITDGSGSADYANNTSCKWQINVPDGKRIKLDFDQFDTEDNVDIVMIFAGNSTLQENLVAQFSGHKLPPVIITAANEILVWFLSDKHNTYQGWRLHYTATDEPSGVIPRNK